MNYSEFVLCIFAEDFCCYRIMHAS